VREAEGGTGGRVFIVEDDEDIRSMYRILFGRMVGVEVVGMAQSAEEALELMGAARPDVAIIDLSLPGMDGIELCHRLKGKNWGVKLLVVTGYERERFLVQAREAGADDVMVKGNAREIIQRVKDLLG
jgi:two-component system invasion response regulator UvrY